MSEPVQRKLAAILAADITGFSRLVGLDDERTLARLKSELMAPIIDEHRGCAGDGMLIELASVVDAVP